MKGAVCPKNRRKMKKGAEKTKKELDKADAVRDYREACYTGLEPFSIRVCGFFRTYERLERINGGVLRADAFKLMLVFLGVKAA